MRCGASTVAVFGVSARWRCAMRCGTAGTPPRCRRRCLAISPRCNDPGAGGAALAGVGPEALGRRVRRPGWRCRSVEPDGPGERPRGRFSRAAGAPRRAAGAPLWRRTTRAARRRRLCGPSRCGAGQSFRVARDRWCRRAASRCSSAAPASVGGPPQRTARGGARRGRWRRFRHSPEGLRGMP